MKDNKQTVYSTPQDYSSLTQNSSLFNYFPRKEAFISIHYHSSPFASTYGCSLFLTPEQIQNLYVRFKDVTF